MSSLSGSEIWEMMMCLYFFASIYALLVFCYNRTFFFLAAIMKLLLYQIEHFGFNIVLPNALLCVATFKFSVKV